MRSIFTLITLLFYCCNNQILVPDYEKFVHGDEELAYRILYPQKFDKSKKYPIKLFLHGIGERGSNNESQLTYVDKVFLNKKNQENYPSIVVFSASSLNR